MMNLNVNGKIHAVDVEPETPLLWAIRDHLGLAGTKYGCGVAACGACTVQSMARRALLPAVGVRAKDRHHRGPVATTAHPVQRAWIEQDVPQCGYCQTGHDHAAAALLAKKPRPTDADIDAT